MPSGIACAARLELNALPGLPLIAPGDDLGAILAGALDRARITPMDGDVLCVTSKVISRAENRFVDLSTVTAGARALEIGHEVDKDARLVELLLGESTAISRKRRGVLIVRHRLGFVCAQAGIDLSNARPPHAAPSSGPWALLLPVDPDASAERLRARFEAAIGVVITDSWGRPFRLGTIGAAIGVAGLPPLWDRRGDHDLDGRALETTVTAFADQVAAAADLVAGQASEGRAVVHVRGLSFPVAAASARALDRAPDEDLYA